MDPINLATAEAVRDAIHTARTTQAAVKRGARIPHSNWQRRMSGRSSFKIAELQRIARLLGVSLGELCDDAAGRVS
ncbi:hypothetical protein [Nocardia sp. NBC_01009]|uniref:hypothetical protein n=1 Tax=Nocardia sp. NBC_01009 TaxID=2975996 RepID=UPI0038692891|nr:helix-turn-helix domain-containing protein [Nocardia sp. NBC_01009]